MKVLYICGAGRSGSTLLTRLLGQMEGVFSVGELRYVWERSFKENWSCGCGAPFSECAFWNAVVDEAYGGFDRVDLEGMMESKHRVDRMRYIPQLMSPWKSPAYSENLSEYLESLGKFYEAIRKVSDSRVIVDSSKDPSYAYVLANMPNVDLYLVHLVRDSRAVAYSWLRKKVSYQVQGKAEYLRQRNPVASSVGWMLFNLLMEPLKFRNTKHTTVRYEDLIRDPDGTLRKILALVREDSNLSPIMDGATIELRADHTVSGNTVRFQQGPIRLSLDKEWEEKAKPADSRTVTALTWPLLMKYGYLGKSKC